MRPILAAAGALVLLAVGFYWKLTATSEYLWMDDTDLANQVLPWWNYQAQEWHEGRVPLWEPHQWAGQPLIGQAQPGAAYPLNWLLFLTPLKEGKLRKGYLDAYYVLERLLAAFNCFVLCWYLRRSWWASIAAACVYGFGGFIGNTTWPQMVNGAVWAPLVFLFALRAIRQRTALMAACGGFFLGVSWLSGHHQVPIFLTYAVACIWLWNFYRTGENRLGLLRPAAIAAAFFVMTAALQMLPAYEYGRLAVRWVGAPSPVGWKDPIPYEVHSNYSLKPEGVLGLFLPGYAQGFTGYIGSAALLLAIAGALLMVRNPRARGMAWLAGGGLVIALGAATPLHGLAFAWLPMVDKARSPGAAVAIFNAGAAPLVAFGIDALHRRYGQLRVLWRTAAATGALVVILCVTLGAVKSVPSVWAEPRMMLGGFCLLVTAALFAGAGKLTKRSLALAFLAVILVENTSTSLYRLASAYYPQPNSAWFKTKQHDDIAAYFRAQQGPVRVVVDDRVIPYNFGDFHGIDAWGGYLASLTVNLHDTMVDHPKFQQALGITHEVSDKPLHEGVTEVYQAKSGLKVYSRPGAFPRAWTVHQLKTVPSAIFFNAWMASEEADLRQTGVLIGRQEPKIEAGCGDDSVRVLRDMGGLVDLRAEMACPGIVILSDLYFPGWKGTLDGRETEVFEIDGMLRGVVVPKGRHRIEMRYRPWTVTAGAALLVLSVVGLVGLFLQSKRAGATATPRLS